MAKEKLRATKDYATELLEYTISPQSARSRKLDCDSDEAARPHGLEVIGRTRCGTAGSIPRQEPRRQRSEPRYPSLCHCPRETAR